jgi:hypothetical protein
MSANEAGWSVQPAWRTASFCASGECVEVAQGDDLIILRDSTRPQGSMLHYGAAEWRAFIGTVKAGEFDNLSF